MTEQEEEAMAAWLERIWEVETVLCTSERAFYWKGKGAEVKLSVNWRNVPSPAVMWHHKHFGLTFSPTRRVYRVHLRGSLDKGHEQESKDFTPLFRRNCWLSGCDIEATLHEKVEWMQGFTREEIEAWNLKF